MTYVAFTNYTPNASRKKAAIALLDSFKNIMDDVKTRLPFNGDDWAEVETLFGKDEYASGYYMLGEILVKIRDADGCEIEAKYFERAIKLVNAQAQKLLAYVMSPNTPFSDPHKNYGIILAAKMRMLAESFKTKGLFAGEATSHA